MTEEVVAATVAKDEAAADETNWVRLQFGSDLHLEMPLAVSRFGQQIQDCLALYGCEAEKEAENMLPRCGQRNYLALLGDIFNGLKIRNGTYRDFLLRQSIGFEAVFVLAGNHEFYGAEYNACKLALHSLCEEVTGQLGGKPHVKFLDCGSVDLPGTDIRVLGCSLWSYVSEENAAAVGGALTDYSAIRVAADPDAAPKTAAVATVADTNGWHARERQWLEGEIDRAKADGRRCVVLTHHAPTFHNAAAPHHSGSPIGSAFCTSLERLLQPPIVAWLYGHTHWSSWQRYSLPTGGAEGAAGASEGKWAQLSGGATGAPSDLEFSSEASLCGPGAPKGSSVLVASNQLGYAMQGEHTSSRFHPWMHLEVHPSGGLARLSCVKKLEKPADA